ncbi:SpvB/TcaC N-terminal domain-containing protein [Agromyces bracchium]|uniref:Uncharacterized protein n=1 Tax=Agromyces bracchium TaxID=88376 RepID=A0A6I3M480_9MICO|nr:SpvB/TcaC N-terminal domain-containing protein [Agromyces bracchium]MTH68144.1 hypothetical protein [Agromyces bracchium]
MTSRPSTHRTIIAGAVTLALVAGAGAVAAELMGGSGPGDDGQVLPREEQVTPADLGDGRVDWLQYADATEGLSLVGAPEPSSDGAARLSYPLVIPEGRGLTPELSLEYDSGAGNGWAGRGWDLSVGEIAVDTAFGVPHFDPDSESESYLLDGAMLVPNALGDSWAPRTRGDREDFTRQVEGEYERIIRHEVGNGGPDDYFWEVRDKDGGVRWYGGTLDGGGPDGTVSDETTADPDDRIAVEPRIDRSAIVDDDPAGNGNQVRWLLSAQRDVGVNTMTYGYRTLKYKWDGKWVRDDACVASETVLCAQHTYLDTISYTGAAQASGEPADPAYQVKFILETDPDPVAPGTDPTLRDDTVLDATGGYLDLVAERLAYIEVRYGDPVDNPDYDPDEDGAYANRPFDPAQPELGPSRFDRTHAQVAARYRLDYADDSPFGTSLLASVTQGTDPAASATHTFDYHDTVTDGAGTYAGFDTTEQTWDTGEDVESREMLTADSDGSALGMSTSNSAEGHAYIGFNPTIPQKVGSFGGSFQVGGGRTEAIGEWLDLDGDGLPDKVFRTDTNQDGLLDAVKFRLNASGPDGGTIFGPASTEKISGLDTLSGESELSFQLSGEAYPIVTVALGIGVSVAWSDSYFMDVNADGLPDFVAGAKVLFNRLENGVPTFKEGSGGTEVPIIDGETPTSVDPEIQAIRDRLAAQSPLVDTVRRWIAPFDGTIDIDAVATLVGTSVDGVRVSIEHADGATNADVVDPVTLAIGQSAFTSTIEDEEVSAGDRLYFRVHSIDDGVGDEVTWAPAIRYTAIDGFDLADVPLDVNGLSQVEFDSVDDFTLSGRPGTAVGMPLRGEVRFSATIEKTAETTDELELQLQRARVVSLDTIDTFDVDGFEVTRTPDGGAATTTTEDDVVIAADFVGTVEVEADFDVQTPGLPSASNPQAGPDRVAAWLDVDSPIDIHAIAWQPTLDYLSAFDRDGAPVNTAQASVELAPEIDHYPENDGGVSEPWTPDESGSVDALVKLEPTGEEVPDEHAWGDAVLTIKSADGLVAKGSFSLDPAPGEDPDTNPDAALTEAALELDAELEEDEEYWIDLTFASTADVGLVELEQVDLQPSESDDDLAVTDAPVTVHWTGAQGYFALPYRGWAAAGYTAAGARATTPIVEAGFVLDADTVQAPTGLNGPQNVGDVEAQEAEPDPAHAYLAVVEPPVLGCQPVAGSAVATCPPAPLGGAQWQGPRVNLTAGPERMRSSRLGADSIAIAASATGSGGGGSQPGSGTLGALMTRLSVAGPSVSIAASLGPLGGSVGTGPSFGYQDYQDMNGDGFPDSIRRNTIQYTGPRGGLLPETKIPAPLAQYTSQNFTVSSQLGFSAGLLDVKPNSSGNTNATKNNGSSGTGTKSSSATSGQQANASDSGLGGSFGIDFGGSANFSWTNPNESEAHDPDGPAAKVGDDVTKIGEKGGQKDPPILEQQFADMNGDGLPDRVVANAQGVLVNYNLGYGFAPAAVQIATGGFETQTSSGASSTLGFSTPKGEFSGGLALNWDWDRTQYAWIDVNGDGILDKLHQLGTTGSPTVQYGNGSGFSVDTAEPYGDFVDASDIAGVSQGQQVTFDRSDSVGGGFDFTLYIGPLCLPAPVCFLVINPGASYQNSLSASEVTLEDIDGDGFPDSLRSTDDDEVTVRLNRHGETNLLAAVHNPIGGTIEIDYGREGNERDHADSVFTMSAVRLDDGRPDADANDLAFSYEYEEPNFDRLFRQPLGFAEVVENELDATDGSTQRSTVRTYLNDDVFVAGLQTSETVQDAAGTPLRSTLQEWRFRDVRDVPGDFSPVDAVDPKAASDLGALTGTGALGRSIAALMVESESRFHDGAGVVRQETRTDYVYDGYGDALRTHDHGELEDPDDDLVTEITWSDCGISSSMDPQCPPQPDRPSPLWSADACPTWVHTPAILTEHNGKSGFDRIEYREVDGSLDLCNNQSVTRLVESTDGSGAVAITELQYDPWGSYDRIVNPEDANGIRYAVEYVWDEDRHSDIAQTTEFDFTDDEAQVFLDYEDDTTPVAEREGLTSTATFDPIAGKVRTRTDGGGLVTGYAYDSLARLIRIDNPKACGVVEFTYAPNAAGYSYGTAAHLDDPSAPKPDRSQADPCAPPTPAPPKPASIDTVQFVDGLGRVIQTKRDARVTDASGQAVETRIVSGRIVADPLGRTAEEYRSTVDTAASATEFEDGAPATPKTTTEWDLLDRETLRVEPSLTKPGGRDTATAYGFDVVDGITVMTATESDPRDRVGTGWIDVRGNVRAFEDDPADEDARTTSYEYDGTGLLIEVVDYAGRTTTHAYDLLGQRTATTTPDGGLVEYGYDPAGRLSTELTPNLREAGDEPTRYGYELDRLVSVDYAEGTPSIRYEYGDAADGGGAGRVVGIDDGARILTRVYDELGEPAIETAEMKLHNWEPDVADPERFQWTTRFTRDPLGRLTTVTLPDEEVLHFGYDSGGLAQSVHGLEQGLERELVGVDASGEPIYVDRAVTRRYDYVLDRGYDELLRPTATALGNGVETDWTYEEDTTWLKAVRTVSPNRNVGSQGSAYQEVQDLRYTYDLVGNPKTYRNDLPADVSNLFGGLVTQTYHYDGYDRLDFASGDWTQAPKQNHRYTFDLEYDDDGNVESKTQVHTVNGKRQKETSYSFDRTYAADRPHQVATQGGDRFHYDADGNLTGISDSRDRWVRQITWNAADRMTEVIDGNTSTEYRYDDAGRLAIERGPNGETAFINEWATVRNGNELVKHVWLDDERVVSQRDPGDDPYEEETQRYWLHTDLQGSTNLLTDANGDTFQHHEYFPTGEVWVDESSNVYRTPYQYGGGYTDERRDLIAFGQRWYDQRRELFTAPDPVLVDDPEAIVGQPDLRAAYTYAGANALAFVDPGGDRFGSVLKNVARPFTQLKSKIGQLVAKVQASRAAAVAAKPTSVATPAKAGVTAKAGTKPGAKAKAGKPPTQNQQQAGPNKLKAKLFTADTAESVVQKAKQNFGSQAMPGWYSKYHANYKLADKADPGALFEYDVKTKTLEFGAFKWRKKIN